MEDLTSPRVMAASTNETPENDGISMPLLRNAATRRKQIHVWYHFHF